MGNAGSMDQTTYFKGHGVPTKLPMPESGELEERFAIVLVRTCESKSLGFVSQHAPASWDRTADFFSLLYLRKTF